MERLPCAACPAPKRFRKMLAARAARADRLGDNFSLLSLGSTIGGAGRSDPGPPGQDHSAAACGLPMRRAGSTAGISA